MNNFLFFFICPFFVFCQPEFIEVESLFKNKQYNRAEEIITNYLEKHPNNMQAIELLGDTFGYLKNWDKAIEHYKKLVEAKENEANYHYKYGGALGMKALENKFKAISFIGDVKSSFLKAAELDKNHIEARWALLELFIQLPVIFGGNKAKAFHYAEELENLSKVDGYLAKGYFYENYKQPKLAEKYYILAIDVGGSLKCFDRLTTLYENKKEPKKAIENIERSQKKHSRNALHYQIGKVAAEYNVELKKGEQCLKTYLKNYSAADGVPKAWAHYRLAQIHIHNRNKNQAIKHIDLAILELPKVAQFKAYKKEILRF